VVVLKPDQSGTEEEIIQLCKDNLASYKKPKSVDFVDVLPKTPIGKILRREIRSPYWKDMDKTIG
jgi:acyl-CoA synthetase (AMP-forming)/AMP-acid ligase II